MNTRTALVTGHLGLLGRHMMRRLEIDGWEVDGFDIVGGTDCREIFTYHGLSNFDLVVHAAYHVGGRVGIDGVNANFAKNVELDGALFHAAIKSPPKHLLYFSSSAAYPVRYQTKEWIQVGTQMRKRGLRECQINFDRPELPDASYGWAKLTGELLAHDARRSGLNITVVRPFSGYAEDQSMDYPLPSIVKRAIDSDFTVWGPVGQTRDWIHIDDIIEACMILVESQVAGPINLCTGRGVAMAELMRMVAKRLNLMHPNVFTDTSSPGVHHLIDKPTGVFYRVGNPTLLHSYYTPRVSLEEGIDRTITHIMGQS